MNTAADPAFVAAEVAYRFETGHVRSRPARRRRGIDWARLVHPWAGRRSSGTHTGHRHARTQRA